MKALYLVFIAVLLVGSGLTCGQPEKIRHQNHSSPMPDCIPLPPPKVFSWWAAGDKYIWLDIARNWYGYDTLIAAAMCDSFIEKSRIAWNWMPEVKKYGLPDSSIFFEYLDLSHIKKDRALVLWVDHPEVDFATDGSEKGCGSRVYGLGEVSGDRALLLLDTKRKKVLQRLDSISDGEGGADFAAPFVIEANATFHCSVSQNDEYDAWGITTVLYPLDLDGDGLAAEFLFYHYIACGVHDCAVIAYDPAKDNLLQRAFRLKTFAKTWEERQKMVDTFYVKNSNWVLQFPLDSVEADGRIRYWRDIGHGSYVTFHYDLKFNPKSGLFEGTLREQLIGN